MGLALVIVLLVVLGSARPLSRWYDRATDAPVMRREFNAGTRRWRDRKRLREAERRRGWGISAGDESNLHPDDYETDGR